MIAMRRRAGTESCTGERSYTNECRAENGSDRTSERVHRDRGGKEKAGAGARRRSWELGWRDPPARPSHSTRGDGANQAAENTAHPEAGRSPGMPEDRTEPAAKSTEEATDEE
jgi:hypothetical protein